VISFDPDAAGQGAAAKSCELLVAEGFEVNVAILPSGEDPDTYIRKHRPEGYRERLSQSRPYLEYLLDRAAAGHNLNTDEGRVKFLSEMLPIAGRIPDLTVRDRFADRLAHKARVTDEVVRAEIRRAATQGKTALTSRQMPNFGKVTKAEKGLIWLLLHDPERALPALDALEADDLEGLTARSVLDLARKLNKNRGFSSAVLLEHLSTVDAQLVTAIASESEAHVKDADGCARSIKQLRCEREHTAIQREIDRLQELSASEHSDRINALWAQKLDLLKRIEELIQ
jgi:DNA primase